MWNHKLAVTNFMLQFFLAILENTSSSHAHIHAHTLLFTPHVSKVIFLFTKPPLSLWPILFTIFFMKYLSPLLLKPPTIRHGRINEIVSYCSTSLNSPPPIPWFLNILLEYHPYIFFDSRPPPHFKNV